jgi:DNA-binding CsgD family transcriptional regulator
LLLCDALIKGGESARVYNDVARRALEHAEALGDGERASQACQYAISGLRGAKGFGGWAEPDVVEWTAAAVKYAPDGTPARVWADGALGRMKVARGEGAEGLLLIERALQLARELDDDTAVWVGGVFWLEAHMAPQFVSQSLGVAQELLQRQTGNVSPLVQRPALAMIQQPFWHTGDRDSAEAVLQRGIVLAERTRQPNLEIHALNHAAFRAVLDGRLEEAVEVSSLMLARAEELGLTDFVVGGGLIGSALRSLICLGRPEDVDHLPLVGDGLLALGHAVCGRDGEAAACIDLVLARRGAIAPADDLNPIWNDMTLLEAALLIRHEDAVRFVYARFAGASVNGINRVWGVSIPRLLGEVAVQLRDQGAARRYYTTAVRVCTDMGFRPEKALAQLGLAEVLYDLGRAERAEAGRLLAEATEDLEAMGMRPALERARLLAGAAPSAATTQTPAYPDGLSAREVEVLRLLAAGKSNQQIADELVISMNTVIRHVSNIFAKIGASNRTEAASYAHRQELV